MAGLGPAIHDFEPARHDGKSSIPGTKPGDDGL
jgi:hypothetical protein